MNRIELSRGEKQEEENRAEIYSILVTTEMVEKAYIRDTITPQAYTPVMLNLLVFPSSNP
jgi:hypothetical protein